MPEYLAKPVIKDQFWIVTDGEKKVGNIEANVSGYSVSLNGSNFVFDSTTDIKKSIKISFESMSTETKPVQIYDEYPTPKKIFNSVIDVQKGLHLFTTSKKSKCYQAAGYFVVDQGKPQVILCPKYIFLQRYTFHGPFKTKDEAEKKLNTL